jgi:hypothetical protein
MLNLFKLPFRVKNHNMQNANFPSDFSTGLLASLLKQNKNLSSEEFDQACEVTAREIENLQQQLGSSDSNDSYELMAAALRRIEKDLKR